MKAIKARVSPQRAAVVLMDVGAVIAAYYGAFFVRFGGAGGFEFGPLFKATLLYVSAAHLLAAFGSRLYSGIHHFASVYDLENILKSACLGGTAAAASVLLARGGAFPRSVLLIHPVLVLVGLSAIRMAIFKGKALLKRAAAPEGPPRRVILVGAGEMGDLVMTQLRQQRAPSYAVVGIVDDDPSKKGMRLQGVRIHGGRGALKELLRASAIDEVIIAIAARRGDIVRAVVEAAGGAAQRPQIRIAPSLEEMLRSPRGGVSMRKVRPADLLNREEIKLDAARIGETFRGKTVLISGAGGTIGGELSRQVMRYAPERVVLLENHATALFYSEKELLALNTGARVIPVLGDVRDEDLLDRVFRDQKPHVVLHAAAHKHVHQLESNIQEGVSNNTLGTYYLARAAERHGAEVFLLVSTDKAVRPSCVMGATKRAAEAVVKSMAQSSRTRFVAVRFGNVLGSSGSVLKIFQEQIEKGEPITVTDADATRYFMTVEEAAGLILQAASISKGGDIFVLKMGQPVRIMEMAKNLIALSGLDLGRDISINVTALRQGEKLHEELIEDPAGADESEHPDIMRLRAENIVLADLEKRMLDLGALCRGTDAQCVLQRLLALVPTFQPAAEHALREPSLSEEIRILTPVEPS